jgi:hypothetical protein
MTSFDSFDAFWPYYVREHAQPLTRTLHFIGTGCFIGLSLGAFFTAQPWLFPIGIVAGYGFAWIGHFFVEKNRPATFKHPLWSLRGDFRMFGLMLRGRMGDQLRAALAS